MTTHTPSRGCYQRGCQSDECKQINYQYMSRLRLDHHRGQRRRTDATQSRHHVERLLAADWTQAQIARAARLAHRTIGAVITGAPNVSTQTALAILSVPIGPAPADTRDVDATGTTRRIRALVACGWPIAHLANRFGMYPTALGNIARGQLAHVRATTADLIALDYRELSETAGPSQRSRSKAAANGWAPPAAWDDETIEDPNAHPEWTGYCGTDRGWWKHNVDAIPACPRCETAHAAWLAERRNLPAAERFRQLASAKAAASQRSANLAHDARELMRVSGLTREQAAARLGVHKTYVDQAMKAHPQTGQELAA
ncbi:hypothetical protein PV733_31730 [Streptomyces europaeiscabiei]|uniref:hypothetical protein n=1 Tax=Streptomyces europaeiscabiei TaxID=146819 RepID=UPI0029AEC87F|nr:hypothetical protein [Streptomyces europaeiscabiei]MDX3713435.1 hypothetical protein [Streptomyces europaeiscabiei]